MNTEQTLTQMRELRLSNMAQSMEDRLARGEHRNADPEEFVAQLVSDELEARKSKRIKNLIRRAQLHPEQACLENIRYNADRGFGKIDLKRFYNEDWISRAENMIFTGATGTGKTYLAEAMCFQACRMGHCVIKVTQDMLLEEIRVHRATGKYAKFLKAMEKTRILVIDDFLIGEYNSTQYCEILNVLENRIGKNSIIITSQYPTDKWFERIPDATVADAICDRLLMTSWILQMKGKSLRVASSKKKEEQ